MLPKGHENRTLQEGEDLRSITTVFARAVLKCAFYVGGIVPSAEWGAVRSAVVFVEAPKPHLEIPAG
jgi:hypothetical protein